MSLAPDGRRLLRIEARNSATPVERKPEWIKAKVNIGPEYVPLKKLVKTEGLHTVCEEAGCPNIFECWEDREATFLIGGSECTRRCDFCQIDTGKPAAAGPGRAVQGRPVRQADGPALRDRDRGRPRRPGGRGHLALRRDRAPDPPAEPRHRGRAAHPRLLRQPGVPGRDLRLRPGGLRAQPRDRAAPVQVHPPRVPLRTLPGRHHPRPGQRDDHQVQPDPGHGRDPRGSLRGHGGPGARPAATCSPSPSTCAPPNATTRWSAGSSPRSSSNCSRRPRSSASSGSCPAPWCAPPTAPDGSGPERCARRACPSPRPWRTSKAPATTRQEAASLPA